MRPKLKPHQLRPCDSEEDLDPKYRQSYVAMGQKAGNNNHVFTVMPEPEDFSKF